MAPLASHAFQITRAVYGKDSRSHDCLAKMPAFVRFHNGLHHIEMSGDFNNHFGDPCHGTAKTMQIDIMAYGQHQHHVFSEGQNVNITAPPPAADVSLAVAYAVYGNAANTSDVTSKVQGLIREVGGVHVIDYSGDMNTLFGDPAPGVVKHLNIDYWSYGVHQHVDFIERTPILITGQGRMSAAPTYAATPVFAAMPAFSAPGHAPAMMSTHATEAPPSYPGTVPASPAGGNVAKATADANAAHAWANAAKADAATAAQAAEVASQGAAFARSSSAKAAAEKSAADGALSAAEAALAAATTAAHNARNTAVETARRAEQANASASAAESQHAALSAVAHQKASVSDAATQAAANADAALAKAQEKAIAAAKMAKMMEIMQAEANSS
jgi:hypothetical protein